MNLPVNQKHFLSFSRKLFLSVISLFLVFAACFIAYQYQREKEYKVELLHSQLQDYNARLNEKIDTLSGIRNEMNEYINNHALQDLRVTVIDLQGNVLYDSYKTNNSLLENHITRPEVEKALATGSGFDVRRTSETTGVPYFYSATLYNDYIIRSAILSQRSKYGWMTLSVAFVIGEALTAVATGSPWRACATPMATSVATPACASFVDAPR